MADDNEYDEEQEESTVPEIWLLAKPPVDEDAEDPVVAKRNAAAAGPRVGKLVKLLNDLEDPEELEQRLSERDPATGMSLLQWATLAGKFVLVEWLIKAAKRGAFAFTNDDKELIVFDKWVEIRKEIEERERELALNPPEEEEEEDPDEEKPAEPTPAQQVLEALSEYQEDWGRRAECVVKVIGELGVYQGARDAQTKAKTGLGQSLFPNGDMYCGEYKENRRHGKGTYWFQDDGMLYIGEWHNGKRHGLGRMVYPDGGRYFGSWVNDERVGQGRYTYPDGSAYTGEWSADVKHGLGEYRFTDGSSHVGTFVDGEFTTGEWVLAGNTRYAGAFAKGRPYGQGVFTFRHGGPGTFRQEGQYLDGLWVPGPMIPSDAVPTVTVALQARTLEVCFTPECAAQKLDALVHAMNFPPTRRWLATVEKTNAFSVQKLQVAEIRRENGGSTGAIAEVTLKFVAEEGGRRFKGPDTVTLRAPSTRLLVLLACGDKRVAVLESSPAVAAQAESALTLPTVTAGPSGRLHGPFVAAAQTALRVDLNQAFTVPLQLTSADPAGFVVADSERTDTQQRCLLYIQHVHADTLTTAQARLDAAFAAQGQTRGARCVQLEDATQLTADAMTALATLQVQALDAAKRLPIATVDAQRPPTPVPPAPEARPDIEPLLATERERLLAEAEAAAAAAEEDE